MLSHDSSVALGIALLVCRSVNHFGVDLTYFNNFYVRTFNKVNVIIIHPRPHHAGTML